MGAWVRVLVAMVMTLCVPVVTQDLPPINEDNLDPDAAHVCVTTTQYVCVLVCYGPQRESIILQSLLCPYICMSILSIRSHLVGDLTLKLEVSTGNFVGINF